MTEISVTIVITKHAVSEDFSREQRMLHSIATRASDPRPNLGLGGVEQALQIDYETLKKAIIDIDRARDSGHLEMIRNATRDFEGINDGQVVVDFIKGKVSKVIVSKVEFDG